ncbi:hypothetical protein [Pengzhenrongella sp.]|jgi:hypothetical protein|uniref:hypothetical protein n=1 Tax=Pengzhenrongella sp. TaxID=2888820 RepID=UPI002F93D1A8
MKIRVVAAVALTALSLAGCAGNAADTSAPASPVPAETVQSPVSTPSPSATPTPTEAPSKYGVTKTNARGNLVKAVGQLAGMSDSADGSSPITVEFKITAIDPNFVCTSEYADKPANGRFVALTLDVTTTPGLAQNEIPEVSFNPYDFKVFSPEGTRENDSVGNGFSCLKKSEALPDTIGPGEHAVGKIVLDTANASGSVVYGPSGGGGGYEWGF